MKIMIVVTIVLLCFISCDKSTKLPELDKLAQVPPINQHEWKDQSGITNNSADSTTLPDRTAGKKEDQKQPGKTISIPNQDWDKKIVRNASINLEVKDYNNYYSSLREKVKSLGGYVSQEEQSLSSYKTENSIIIKVPVDQFDNAVVLLTNNIEKLNEKKISSQDVTAELVDTKSRMEAKRQVRERYIDLLKQAKNMEEILHVQTEINTIQEEIEAAAGRIEYLGHAAAFSTINLSFFQVLNSSAKDEGVPSFSNRLGDAFKTGGSWIIDLMVGLVALWPLLLLVLIIIIFWKRSVAKGKQQAA